MPVTSFADYAQGIAETLGAVLASGHAKHANQEIEQRSMVRGLIGGVLLFVDDSELHFREYIDASLAEPRLMYVYHYQDAAKTLVFRYDNARHRPPLTQAEHRHTPTTAEASLAPTLEQVIDEILK